MFNLRLPLSSLLACGLLLLTTDNALAQPPSDVADSCASTTPDPAAADELFRLGADLYRRGDPEGAAKRFIESYCLWPSAKTLQVLAQCREKQNQFASAYSIYQKASELARDTRRSGVEADCKQRAEKIAELRSFLTIRVASAVPGLSIERNGNPLGEAQYGVRLPIDPGEYVLTARAAGFAPLEQRITIGIRADDRTIFIPRLQPLPQESGSTEIKQPELAPMQPPSQEGSISRRPEPVSFASIQRSNPWPWVLGGVGLTSLVVGAVSGTLALHDKSSVDDACYNQSPCADRHALSIQSRRDLEWTMARVTVPIGLIAIAGAATWLTLDSPKRERAAMHEVDASVDDHSGTLWVRGRF